MSAYRTNAEREALCSVWKKSNQTKKEFCKQNNICKKTFYRWLSKFLSNGKNVSNVKDDIGSMPIKFLQVGNATPERNFLPENFLEITLPSGINFKVSVSQDNISNFLQELLKWK